MSVTLSGIVTFVSLEQFQNALPPMVVTVQPPKVAGMVISPLISTEQSVIVASPFDTV